MKVVYVIPSKIISGGVNVVFYHAALLKKSGFKVNILSLNDEGGYHEWLDSSIKVISKKEFNQANYDIAIATHWSTAKFVNSLKVARKIYFVQSDERRFELDEVSLKKCDDTYRLNMDFMTEALWIQRWLKEEFGHNAYYVPNGIDMDLFYRDKPLKPRLRRPRVLLEGPIDVFFKGMSDAYEAVKNIDCEVWIVSSIGRPRKDWKYDKFFHKVPIKKMKNIYSSCDVMLKMSRVEGFFGPPLEAMACGCAVVVSKCTGYDEYIVHNKNALVVDMGDIGGAESAVKRIFSDGALANRLIKNGYSTANKWSWDRSNEYLLKVLDGSPPVSLFSKGNHRRYDFVEEIRKVHYQIEIARHVGRNISQSDKWIKHLEKDIDILNSEITRIKNDPVYKLAQKLKTILKKIALRK